MLLSSGAAFEKPSTIIRLKGTQMLSRIRKTMSDDEGFTLIELLVVIIIIGILAAIAIPVFLNQRVKGWEAASKSDVRNAGLAMETYFTDANAYPTTFATLTTDPTYGQTVKASNGVTTSVISVRANNASFCLKSINSSGGSAFYYDSAAGGLQGKGVTCT